MSEIVGIIFFNRFLLSAYVLHTELDKQLADTMVLPIIQFREKDLTGKISEFNAIYFQNINSFSIFFSATIFKCVDH